MASTLSVERVSRKTFNSLPEYSASLPTGQRLGKVWKRKTSDGWILGEYVSSTLPGQIGISWRKLEIIEEVGNG